MDYIKVIIRIAEEITAEDRMLAVVNWYLTCFHQTKKVK